MEFSMINDSGWNGTKQDAPGIVGHSRFHSLKRRVCWDVNRSRFYVVYSR